MLILWKIRYIDRATRELGDRYLYLNTTLLDPVTKSAVELAVDAKSQTDQHKFRRFRHLFEEQDEATLDEWRKSVHRFTCAQVGEYHEDEDSVEITVTELIRIKTGDENAVVLPHGARQHDIDLMFGDRTPLPIAEVTLNSEEIRLLGYFCRDLGELQGSAFMKDGPGTLKSQGNAEPVLETSVSDDEIRSFVTIFRRLYMENEPANFSKAIDVCMKAWTTHPYSKWIAGEKEEYVQQMNRTPETRPWIPKDRCSFTRKRLIDVFLYTRYAHQPDSRRENQYKECLAEVGGHVATLTWLFLVEIWRSSILISNAGRLIARWFNRYCEHHNITPAVLKSLLHENPAIGALEKEADRKVRRFEEEAETLAKYLWKQAGEPAGGHTLHLDDARQQLRRALGDEAA